MLGHDVHFMEESGIGKSADVLMDGQPWEFKTVNGAGPDTVTQLLRQGRKQSPRIVVDLRKNSLSESEALKQVDRAQERYGGLERVWVLTREGRIIERSF